MKQVFLADVIKLQLYDPSSRIGQSVRELNHVESAQGQEENILELLDRCQISRKNINKCFELIKRLDRVPMCTAFDLKSLDYLLKTQISHIKVASMDLNNIHLHNRLLSHTEKLNLYISTGMSSQEEVINVGNLYKHCKHDVTFLYCNSSYPTPIESVNLKSIHF